jgi:uncharacterized protein
MNLLGECRPDDPHPTHRRPAQPGSLLNPAVLSRPLDGPEAAEICQTFRRNRRWGLIENAPVMNDVWVLAATPGVARRRLFDARLALTLRHHGVAEFATRNVNDFHDFGFSRVSDPITSNY